MNLNRENARYRHNPAYRCLLLFAAAFATISLGCSSEPRPVAAAPETVSGVPLVSAQKTSVPDWLEATGTVRATQTSQLASQAMGNITELRVREGDRVEPDELLAAIDSTQQRAALDQAQAAETAAQKEVAAADSDLSLAESTLKRYEQLYEKKSVSPQEYDEIKGRQQSAQARHDVDVAAAAQAAAAVAQARKALDNTQIRAPFAGVVTEKKADPGTLAVPGMPLLTLEDTRGYRLEADVDESDIRSIRAGQSVTVTIDALGSVQLTGKVAQIVPAADPASRSFNVKIQLPSSAGLRSGMFGRARFARGQRSAILAPQTAVFERGQLRAVYVVDANQIAGLRYVTLGPSANEQVEVLSGLQPGEKLIAAPGGREYAGKKIVEQP